MTAASKKRSRAAGGRCPICRKPAVEHYRPFCSGRCADIDLARWFTGAYRIPSEEPADDDGGDRDDLEDER